jgi:hypothetical protein
MHHCVATYADRVILGQSSNFIRSRIFSVRNDDDQRLATVQFSGDKLIQGKGKRNALPPRNLLQAALEFLKLWE